MNCQSIISVSALAGVNLHTREMAHVILNAATEEPCNQVELDFSGIDFISRSFADEFHFQRLRLMAERQKTIIYAFRKGFLTLRIPNSLVRNDLDETANFITNFLIESQEQLYYN